MERLKLPKRNIASVYVSCPMSVSGNSFNDAIKAVLAAGCKDVKYWKKGTSYAYKEYTKIIEGVDAFLTILPNAKFKMSIDSMTTGCRKELDIAIKANIPVFILYKATGGWKVYNSTIDEDIIQGVAGSTRNFEEYCQGSTSDWSVADDAIVTKDGKIKEKPVDRKLAKALLTAMRYGAENTTGKTFTELMAIAYPNMPALPEHNWSDRVMAMGLALQVNGGMNRNQPSLRDHVYGIDRIHSPELLMDMAKLHYPIAGVPKQGKSWAEQAEEIARVGQHYHEAILQSLMVPKLLLTEEQAKDFKEMQEQYTAPDKRLLFLRRP